MPPLSKLPSKIKRKRFCSALEKCGFRIDYAGGKGSHCKATHTNEKCFPIKKNLDKYTLKYLLKEIEDDTGVEWDDIKKHL